MQYANWYKSIYGMPLEYRPDNDVIADDTRLDSWYDTFVRDQAKKAGHKGDPRYSFLGEEEAFQVPQFGAK